MLDTTPGLVESVLSLNILKMQNLDLRDKRVLIREDLNVPIQDGAVSSDARIPGGIADDSGGADGARAGAGHVASGPARRGQVRRRILARPPWPKRLSQLLGVPVALKKDWLAGVEVHPGEVVLLENVRFNKGEKKDVDDLARKMAALCDIYVMDAFGTAHRAEASTHGVAKYAPRGLRRPLLVSELSALQTALENPARGRCSRSSPAPRCRPNSPCWKPCSARSIS